MPDASRRALLSVSDKTGIVDMAAGLIRLGFEVVSTGGTAAAIAAAGLPVTAVSDVTGFPEVLDGRVKTLHPAVHAGLLAKRTPEHLAQLSGIGVAPIDVVVANLYPFRRTVARADVTDEEAMEQVDIGGPTMIRAAAKNHAHVTVVVDASDYASVLEELAVGITPARRRELALKAFAHTASYDAAIASFLGAGDVLPADLTMGLRRALPLKYGENPHQTGALYVQDGKEGMWERATVVAGAGLSFLNVFDAEAAWRLAHELPGPSACVIVKHANACGAAVAPSPVEAYLAAFEADPKSAFGGVVALPTEVGTHLAEEIASRPKADVLLARSFTADAVRLLTARRRSTRLVTLPPPGRRGLDLRAVDGGYLVQEPDELEDVSGWRVVTTRQPTAEEWSDMVIAYTVCARTSSNAIVMVKDGVALGVGAGQQSRVDAVEIAAKKAAGRAVGGACASDAFFPFRDGLDAAAAAGITAVVQPGGSVKDGEIVAAAEERSLAMVFTGHRHFRH